MSTLISTPMPRRVFSILGEAQSYRNLVYLLLGLPLGTLWFSVLVTGLSVAVSMVAVALIGIPMLLAMWWVTRLLANVERQTANVLLGVDLSPATISASAPGSVLAKLRAMTKDEGRRKELGYLILRFPAGLATFMVAVTALALPFMVAAAPFQARYGGRHPFGHWAGAARIGDVASASPWSWSLVPFGAVLLIATFHLLNAVARVCGRWATAWLAVATPSTMGRSPGGSDECLDPPQRDSVT